MLVIDFELPADAGKVYTEYDWSPVTIEQGLLGNVSLGYRASKKFAEKCCAH